MIINDVKIIEITTNLNHFPQELIDLVFSVAKVTTLNRVGGLLPPSSSWSVQLEWPQKVGGVFEIWTNSHDLVDQILNTDDSHLAELALNNVIGGDWGTVSVNLDKSTLVDQVTYRLEVGTSVGDVGLGNPEHVLGGLVHLDEHSVVDLPQSEELQNLPDLGADLVDTTDSHDEHQLVFSLDIVVSLLLSFSLQPDFISLLILVLLGVLLSTFEDLNTLLPSVDLCLDGELGSDGAVLCLSLTTLQDSLGDCGELGVRHSSLVEVNQAILARDTLLPS